MPIRDDQCLDCGGVKESRIAQIDDHPREPPVQHIDDVGLKFTGSGQINLPHWTHPHLLGIWLEINPKPRRADLRRVVLLIEPFPPRTNTRGMFSKTHHSTTTSDVGCQRSHRDCSLPRRVPALALLTPAYLCGSHRRPTACGHPLRLRVAVAKQLVRFDIDAQRRSEGRHLDRSVRLGGEVQGEVAPPAIRVDRPRKCTAWVELAL